MASTNSLRRERFMESSRSKNCRGNANEEQQEFFRDFDKTTKQWMEDSEERFQKWREEQEKMAKNPEIPLANGNARVGERSFPNSWRSCDAGTGQDPREFRITVDVKDFKPEEISVKTVDNELVVTAKHEDNKNAKDRVSRQFTKKYTLPKDIDPYTVKSDLLLDGTLVITAPKKLGKLNNERAVPLYFQK